MTQRNTSARTIALTAAPAVSVLQACAAAVTLVLVVLLVTTPTGAG